MTNCIESSSNHSLALVPKAHLFKDFFCSKNCFRWRNASVYQWTCRSLHYGDYRRRSSRAGRCKFFSNWETTYSSAVTIGVFDKAIYCPHWRGCCVWTTRFHLSLFRCRWVLWGECALFLCFFIALTDFLKSEDTTSRNSELLQRVSYILNSCPRLAPNPHGMYSGSKPSFHRLTSSQEAHLFM